MGQLYCPVRWDLYVQNLTKLDQNLPFLASQDLEERKVFDCEGIVLILLHII